MIFTAAVIIVLVRFGLLKGIDQIANSLKWSAKARGQITGYATSVPELVCITSAGLSGVWQAGLWNIASSNIINVGLMLFAISSYRQTSELLKRRFLDELLFSAFAVFTPMVLMKAGLDTQWYLVPLLFGLFVIYRMVDARVNRSTKHKAGDEEAVGNLPFGLILLTTALTAITVAGVFLGNATAAVVEQLGIHPAIAGWILGIVTSVPEMVSFFAVYAAAKKEGMAQSLNDTQEALDNLTGSNMSNLGIVYPLGLFVYLIVG